MEANINVKGIHEKSKIKCHYFKSLLFECNRDKNKRKNYIHKPIDMHFMLLYINLKVNILHTYTCMQMFASVFNQCLIILLFVSVFDDIIVCRSA